MDVVDVGGHRMECRMIAATSGGMPVLVFLHDHRGSVDLWQDFPDRVAAATGASAVIYSRLGSGHSDPRPDGCSGTAPVAPPDLPDTGVPETVRQEASLWLPRLLDRLAIADPVLIGHGEGALIALQFPMLSLRPVAALILESFHLESLHNVAPEPGNGQDRISCPVLLLNGERDDPDGIRTADALARRIGGPVESVHVAGAGAIPHQDHPQAVLDAIAGFLRERGVASAKETVLTQRTIRRPGRTVLGAPASPGAGGYPGFAPSAPSSPSSPSSGSSGGPPPGETSPGLRVERIRRPPRPGTPRRPTDGSFPRR